MNKVLLLIFSISSLSFSQTDMDLYTSAVIKLVKENKITKKSIKSNRNDIFVIKRMLKKSSAEGSFTEPLIKTEAEKRDIYTINNYIKENKEW